LLVGEQVENPVAAQHAAELHGAGVGRGDLADDRRLRGGRDERRQPAFGGHVERVQHQKLAGPGYRPGDANLPLRQLDAHPGVQGDLVHRRGLPAPAQVTEAV
jgi:hypothetical protein